MTWQTALALWWTFGVIVLSGDVARWNARRRKAGKPLPTERGWIILSVMTAAFIWPWTRNPK